MKTRNNVRDQVKSLCDFFLNIPQAMALERMWYRQMDPTASPIEDFYASLDRLHRDDKTKAFIVLGLVLLGISIGWGEHFKLLPKSNEYFKLFIATIFLFPVGVHYLTKLPNLFMEWNKFRAAAEELNRLKRNPLPLFSREDKVWREFARKELVQIAIFKITAAEDGEYIFEGELHVGFKQMHECLKQFGLVEEKWGTYFDEAKRHIAEVKARQAAVS